MALSPVCWTDASIRSSRLHQLALSFGPLAAGLLRPTSADLYKENPHMPFAEMLLLCRQAGKHMRMPCTSAGVVFILTMDAILHMKRIPHVVSMRDAEEFCTGRAHLI